MRKILPAVLILLCLCIQCGEKCPIEPCRLECEDFCGRVTPPPAFPLAVDELTVLTIAGSGELSSDWWFSAPHLEGTGPQILALATEDTIPVMLGYAFTAFQQHETGERQSLVLDPELEAVVGSPYRGVQLSAASTALALVMINPLMGGAGDPERVWFAARVLDSDHFDDLVDEVTEALVADPENALDGVTYPDIYAKAAAIVADIIAGIEEGRPKRPEGEGPYIEDLDGCNIGFRNPAFVHYGVGIRDRVADTTKSVLLLPRRDLYLFVVPEPPSGHEYALGDGRFEIECLKGFVGFDSEELLNREHPGGLATVANTVRAVCWLVSMFVSVPEISDPVGRAPTDRQGVARISLAVEDGDIVEIMHQSADLCSSDPGQTSAWLFGGLASPSDLEQFLNTVRGVLANAMAAAKAHGLDAKVPFFCDLVTAPEHMSLSICQENGALVSCENAPILTGAEVSPDTGSSSTDFQYRVHYYDEDDEPPEFVQVSIDDSRYDMSLLNGTEADGDYGYTVRLPGGSKHTYYFICADASGRVTRLPASSIFPGPLVINAPQLSEGKVHPGSGCTNDTFWYCVHYYDEDGNSPSLIQVYVDGQPHDMFFILGIRYDGDYRYKTVLSAGTDHTYYFQCTDATGAIARLPGSGVFEGPIVSYAPELSDWLVRPPSGPAGTTFKYEVHYYDGDGDPPEYLLVYVDNIAHGMALKAGTESDGTYCFEKTLTTIGDHTYHFLCADTAGASVRVPDKGSFPGPIVWIPQGDNMNAKVSVHVRRHFPKVRCDHDFPTITGCSDIVTTYPGSDFDCFPVFFDLAAYQALEFGLCWPDWGYAVWQDCADVATGDIRQPGDGVSLRWSRCHPGPVAVPGWAWIYATSPGEIYVCPHPDKRGIYITDCYGWTDEPWLSLPAGVYGAVGADPCGPP